MSIVNKPYHMAMEAGELDKNEMIVSYGVKHWFTS